MLVALDAFRDFSDVRLAPEKRKTHVRFFNVDEIESIGVEEGCVQIEMVSGAVYYSALNETQVRALFQSSAGWLAEQAVKGSHP